MTSLSRIGRLAVVALPAVLLMACGESHVPQMNSLDLTGPNFNQELARNYKDFANYEAYEMYDWTDAVMYADKAMSANAGQPSLPDDLSRRNIADKGALAELQSGRVQLMQALAAGAAEKSPATVARAQANFDCWAEQQEEGWQTAHIAACKGAFQNAMAATNTAMAPMPKPVAQRQAPAPALATPAVAKSGPYLVFFDWNSSVLTAETRRLIDVAIRDSRANGQGIHIIGHADSSGTDAYNMRLSARRAEAVKLYMIANGVARNTVTTEARGERDSLVTTADGVREPQNRYGSINLFVRSPSV